MAPATSTATAAVISLGILVPLSHWGTQPASEAPLLQTPNIVPLRAAEGIFNFTRIQSSTETVAANYRIRDALSHDAGLTKTNPDSRAITTEISDDEDMDVLHSVYGKTCFAFACCFMVEILFLIGCCKLRNRRRIRDDTVGTARGVNASWQVKPTGMLNETSPSLLLCLVSRCMKSN
eukprot:TRINITY_DN106460_c0_g1_i1.p1 TRINITY_DN106460_c0_g1~~TRINITY_DN106460_c0_g1_i1.p1  ORF type:complete len:197 (-),score=20.04 TRINITY_DN106460_c0_g1_i1:299-832(-)